MKFACPLDELQHWLGLLEVDLRLGVARRHVEATARLCWLLVDKLEKDPKMDQEMFTLLSLRLLDLQRQMSPVKPGPKARPEGGPKLSLVPR
jgi:hypothetical protein